MHSFDSIHRFHRGERYSWQPGGLSSQPLNGRHDKRRGCHASRRCRVPIGAAQMRQVPMGIWLRKKSRRRFSSQRSITALDCINPTPNLRDKMSTTSRPIHHHSKQSPRAKNVFALGLNNSGNCFALQSSIQSMSAVPVGVSVAVSCQPSYHIQRLCADDPDNDTTVLDLISRKNRYYSDRKSLQDPSPSTPELSAKYYAERSGQRIHNIQLWLT